MTGLYLFRHSELSRLMSFQTALFLPADLNTLITVFEKKKKKFPYVFLKSAILQKDVKEFSFSPLLQGVMWR